MDMTTEGFLVEEGLDQRYEVLKELGDCHASLGNFDRARHCYAEASLLAPNRAGPHVGRGVVAIQMGCLAEAKEAFGEALSVDDHCAEAWCGLAMLEHQRQDFARAFDLYLKCLDKNSENLVALLGLFQTSCQMGTFAKVIHYLELYLDRHMGDVSVHFCLATLYARDNRLSEAADTLDRILTLDPAHAEAMALRKEVAAKMARATEEMTVR
jgi:tetratricopeptide (TPR) repeat protein